MRTTDKVILTISSILLTVAIYGASQVMSSTHTVVMAMITTNGGK